jgi:Ca-activated chloride channel homolog
MTAAKRLNLANALFVLSLLPSIWAFSPQDQSSPANREQDSQITVPARPTAPVFQGEQGKQGSEIEFSPSTRTVTLELQVQDPNGYFLPNIRRENFAVYEDGVKQKIVTVEVEHAPVSVALLLEMGGRYHGLNRALALEVPQIGRQLLEVIGRADKVAVLKYDSKVETLVDFDQGHELLDEVFDQLSPTEFSETNLYDALMATLGRMREVSGRKAIILVSSGVDIFSKADFQQVLQAAQTSGTPIYAISLVRLMQREAQIAGSVAPFAHIDWNEAERKLEQLANASGGRAYLLESDVQIPAIYDDIMENLRLRYLITYVSSNNATSGPPREVRVELIDPKTGAPLKIRDSSGKTIVAKVFVQGSYSPGTSAALAKPSSTTEHLNPRYR